MYQSQGYPPYPWTLDRNAIGLETYPIHLSVDEARHLFFQYNGKWPDFRGPYVTAEWKDGRILIRDGEKRYELNPEARWALWPEVFGPEAGGEPAYRKKSEGLGSKVIYALAAMAVAAGLLLVPGISEHKAGKAEKSVSVPEQIPTDTTGKYSDTGSGAVSGAGTPGPIDTTDEYSSCISEIRSELERLTGKRLSTSSVKEVISSTAPYLDPEYFRNFDIFKGKNTIPKEELIKLDTEIFPKYACENIGKERLKKNLEELYHNFTINGKPFVVFGDPEKVKTLKENMEELKDVCTGSLDLLPEKEPTIVIISGSPSPYGLTHTNGEVIIITRKQFKTFDAFEAIDTIVHEDSHITGFPARLAEIYLKLIRGEEFIPDVDREKLVQDHILLIPLCGPTVEVKYEDVTIDNKTGRVPVVETGIEGETTKEYLERIGVDELFAGDEEGFVERVWEELQRTFRYANESEKERIKKYYSPPENITVDVTEDVEKLREDFPWILDSLKYINTTEVK